MFDSLTPSELVRAMSNTLRSVASPAGTSGSEFDRVQCLSGASIGRYLAQELTHARELEDWFRQRVDDALTEGAASGNGSFGSLCHQLSRRIKTSEDIDETGGEIADYLRDLDTLPDAEGRRHATALMHRCLRDLADRQVQLLLGEYPGDDEGSTTGPGNR